MTNTLYTVSGGGSGGTLEKDIVQSGHGLTVGNIITFDGSDYIKAQADSAANAETVGIVSAVTDLNNFTFRSAGYIDTLSGLVAGDVYFLSDATAGLLTSTEPTTLGSISKAMLIATSTTTGFILEYRGIVITSGTGAARTNIFNDWDTSTYSKATNYLASTDGIVCTNSSNGHPVYGYTDATATPTQLVVSDGTSAVTGAFGIVMPVKKGDYWRVDTVVTANILWIPIQVIANASGEDVTEGTAKGWINLNGTGVIAIRDSYNVSSIADVGTGAYTVYWDTDFANANYASVFTCNAGLYPTLGTVGSHLVGSVTLSCVSYVGAAGDCDTVCLIAMGDQ